MSSALPRDDLVDREATPSLKAKIWRCRRVAAVSAIALVLATLTIITQNVMRNQPCLMATLESAAPPCEARLSERWILPWSRIALERRYAASMARNGRHKEGLALLETLAAKTELSFYDNQTKAIALVGLGRHDEAADLLESLSKANPENDALFVDFADVLIQDGNYARLESAARARTSQPRATASAFVILSRALYELGKFEEAKSEARKALAIDSQYVDALNLLALTLEKTGEMNAAMGVYDTALEIEPANNTLLINRGVLHDDLGNTDKAERDFRVALATQRDYYTLAYIARILLDRGELPEARRLASEASLIQPENSFAIMLMGRYYYEVGQLALARERLNKALKLDPGYPTAIYWLAIVDYANDDFASAEKGLRKALETWPGDLAVTNDLADTLINLDRPAEAAALLSKLLETSASHARSLSTRARANNYMSKWDEAIVDATKAMELEPERPLHLFRRAYAYWGKGDLQAARKDYDALTKNTATQPGMLEERASFLINSGDTEEARRAVSTLQGNGQPSSQLLRLQGSLAEGDGNYETAISFYQKAAELDPKNGWLLEDKAWAYNSNSQPGMALQTCLEMQKAMPDEPASFRCKAKAYDRMGKTKDAISALQDALKRKPDYNVGRFDLALLELGGPQNESAIEELSLLIARKYELAYSYFYRAVAHEFAMRYVESERDYKASLRTADESLAKEIAKRVSRLEARQPLLERPGKNVYPQRRRAAQR